MDYMISATVKGEPVRVFAADTTVLVSEGQRIHQTSPTASAALGRTMTATALMTMMLKNEKDKISVQIKSDGPTDNILVVGNNKGEIKGDIYNPLVDIPLNDKGKLDVRGAVGKGTLTIIKDLGLKNPYIGTVQLVSGEIAEDFAYYFAISEQVPSVVSLGVLVNHDWSIKKAGGFIIQLMPGYDEEMVKYIENRIGQIPSITTWLESGKKPEDIISTFFEDFTVDFNERKDVQYHCDCSRERFESGLISLGPIEIEEMMKQGEEAEVICHFCNKKYIFENEDLEKIYDVIK